VHLCVNMHEFVKWNRETKFLINIKNSFCEAKCVT